MKRFTVTLVWVLFLILSLLHPLLLPAGEEPILNQPSLILIHHLDIRLNPADHILQARDTLQVQTNPGLVNPDRQSFSFFLNKNLKVTEVYQSEAERAGSKVIQPLLWQSVPRDDRTQEIRLQISPEAEGQLSLILHYEGVLYDPVQKSQALSFVTGDETTGLIGEEGVYLSQETHWYPDIPESLGIFNLVVTIPEPFVVVTQGELLSRETESGLSQSRWRSGIPADSLTLVAGKYQIQTENWDGVAISTYFSSENAHLGKKFIQAAGEYIRLYSGILGKYPYKKFDIVENFFSSGYGFPTFTLLGGDVIRQGERALQPGYLDHEIVHSWFGNYVLYDPDKGNWVEALTTYCANYYYKELKQGEEAAFKHRKGASQRYSIRVTPEKDYPVRAFKGKTEDFENDIGYTKGSMIFHQLRRWIGDDLFFVALKEIIRQYGGQRADWNGLQKVFEEVSHQSLDWFFTQWLDLKGGPELKLEETELKILRTGSPEVGVTGQSSQVTGYQITGKVTQLGDIYQLRLPIQVNFKDGQETFDLDLTRRENSFTYTVKRPPLSLILDPEYHVFRKIALEAITPCLNALLEDKDKLFVYLTAGSSDEITTYRGLAEMAAARKGGKVLPDSELTEDLLAENSTLIFGNPGRSEPIQPWLRKWLRDLPGEPQLEENIFKLDGKEYKREDQAFLATWRNPQNPKKYLTFYFGLSSDALSRARYLFYYGWDSYLIFEKGRPVQRGDWTETHSDTSFLFPVARSLSTRSDVEAFDKTSLINHIQYLASEELEGRYPGTEGSHKAATYIKEKFREYGLSPVTLSSVEPGLKPPLTYEQPFSIMIRDLKEFQISFQNSSSRLRDGIPLVFSPEGFHQLDLVFAGYGLVTPDYNDYEGLTVQDKAVLILDEVPDFLRDYLRARGAISLLFEKIRTAQERGAKALIVYVEANLDTYASYITYPSRLPEPIAREISKAREKENFISLEMEIQRILSNQEQPPFEVKIPVILIPYYPADNPVWLDGDRTFLELEEQIERTQSPVGVKFASEGTSLNLKIKYDTREIKTGNVLGFLPGQDQEVIVLGAHYDHLGTNPQGEIFYGADDNASGIAALLEIARVLSTRCRDSFPSCPYKRGVLFIAFGAEEWGLIGSQFYVEHPVVPNDHVVAMLNLDSIGKGKPREIYLVGSSVYPGLASISRKYMAQLGLTEGVNIDKFAFHQGTDHYPFHLKAIPALEYFASNYKELHTLQDTVDRVQPDKVAQVAQVVFLTALELLTTPELPPLKD